MSRIRSFEAPHKGLRNIISKFSYHLGYTDPKNPKQLRYLKELGQEMFVLLNNHVHTENEVTLKELEARVPGSSAHDLSDHEFLEKIQESLDLGLQSLNGNESHEEMHAFYLEFSNFHCKYLEHIYEEETVTEKLLQNNFSDEELVQHRMSIMNRIDPSVMLLWLKYIIPAQGIPESIDMLSGFRSNAPRETFNLVIDSIRPEMSPDRFQLVLSNFKES